ncbi:MAG: hypothetical protein FWG90_08055 [Oscillospiraceae bacterium]|nr:hypothetical protein [Oscillospiraceae bacterium]
MKKTNILWAILNLVFLVIFNAIFFIIGGTEHNTSVWISYAFIHFAYFMLLLTPRLIRRGKSTAVFGFSLFAISTTYFLLQFVTGIIFILIAPDSYCSALLVQLCIAGLNGIIVVANMIANERTAEAEEKRQHQIAYVKEASVKIKGLLDKIDGKEERKIVTRVYDAIYSSPVKSHPNLIEIENRIIRSINELEHAVATGNKDDIISLANSLLPTINERNNLREC